MTAKIWDILFGTYQTPTDATPERFGTATPVPAGLIGQMLFPFPGNRPRR
jgi:sterol desaturase/sphingolipid hydroxylase (fatty acid hydroxylase superfamily)